jgi:hypothetical protein
LFPIPQAVDCSVDPTFNAQWTNNLAPANGPQSYHSQYEQPALTL